MAKKECDKKRSDPNLLTHTLSVVALATYKHNIRTHCRKTFVNQIEAETFVSASLIY